MMQLFIRRRDGFTLTEIIVAMAIISILAAIAIPNWSTLLPNYALKSAARQVQSELHKLKSRAVSENANFRLVFSTTSYSFEKYSSGSYTATGESRTLPDGITLAGTSDTTLGFTSRGTSIDSTDKTVKLCNIKSSGKNVVLSDLGRIRIDDASC
jgi:prepilin-type N-terminal cleavage/methylation domain-containing protein